MNPAFKLNKLTDPDICKYNFCKINKEFKLINSINKFHPVGHGTFFTGFLYLHNGKSLCRFSWVYDCGSKREKSLIELIKKLPCCYKNTIDMFCLSHFDKDHINGVENFIKSSKLIRNLVLPYIPFNQRLAIAFETTSIDVMIFALDPIGFLQSKNLIDKVEKIFLIQASDKKAPDLPINEPVLLENESNEFPDIFPEGKQPNEADYPTLLGKSSDREKQKEISGNDVKNILSKWEFVFFNSPLESIKSQSGASILSIHESVSRIINSEEHNKDKIKKLQDCYTNHFGSGSRNKNKISLCVLSRPLNFLKEYDSYCSINDSQELSSSHKNKFGMLLTGDILLEDKTIKSMQNHFGVNRWNDIFLMQIPHHGSKHSWKGQNQQIFQNVYSVLCVPDEDKYKNHPHENVLRDLTKTIVVRANYSTSVKYKITSISFLNDSKIKKNLQASASG